MTEDYNSSWEITLDKTNCTEVWDPDVNDSNHVFRGKHTLFLKQAVLGLEVPDDEVNVIIVEAMGHNSKIKLPIVSLKRGTGQSQCVLHYEFPQPPITFTLLQGNGPIHLLGNISVGTDDEINEEIKEEEEEIEEKKKRVDELKRKLAVNSNSKGNKAPKRPKIDKEVEFTLDKTKGTEVWDPDVNDSNHVFRGKHTLFLKQAVLGLEVPDDEVNVIIVEAMGHNSKIKLPIVSLKRGTGQSQCVLHYEFPQPPITFTLLQGNGPIHLLGNISVGTDEDDDDDDDVINEEIKEEEEEIEEAIKRVDELKRKLAVNSNSKGNKAPKRPKIDKEVD